MRHEFIALGAEHRAACAQNQGGKQTTKASTENALHVLEKHLNRIERALCRRIVNCTTSSSHRLHKAEERTHKAKEDDRRTHATVERNRRTRREHVKSNRRIEADILLQQTLCKFNSLRDNARSRFRISVPFFARIDNFVFGDNLLHLADGRKLLHQENDHDGDHDDPAKCRGAKIKSACDKGYKTHHRQNKNRIECIFHFLPTHAALDKERLFQTSSTDRERTREGKETTCSGTIR